MHNHHTPHKALHVPDVQHSQNQPNKMLVVSEITKERGGRRVLDHVSFTGHEGECIVVCGPSGSGKTTLLRAIAGLERIDSGSISIRNVPNNSPSGPARKKGEVGMVFQGEQLYRHLTLLDNIMLGPLRVLKQSDAVTRRHAMELLDAVGLVDKMGRYPGELSGGERQRGAIARTLAMSPKLILFDEPTSALDPSCIKEVLALVFQLREQGQTMILVTHETAFARMIADRIICMDDGKIREVDVPHNIIVSPGHRVAKQLFGDSLQEISALDRVAFTGTLNVGYFPENGPELPDILPALNSLGGHAVTNMKCCALKSQNPLLQLRMGIADIIVTPTPIDDDIGRLHKTLCEFQGEPFYIYLSAADTVWRRAVEARLATVIPPSPPAEAIRNDHV